MAERGESYDVVLARVDERVRALDEKQDSHSQNTDKILGELVRGAQKQEIRVTKLETNLWWVGILASVVASLTYAVIPPLIERMRFSISDSQASQKVLEQKHH